MTELGIPGIGAAVETGRAPAMVTFRAEETDTGKPVTVTVLTTARDRLDRRRFDTQQAALAVMDHHPNIVAVLRHGSTADGHLFVVTPAPTPDTLPAEAGHHRLDGPAVLALAIALAGALETAHRFRVVHGGVSLSSVLIDGTGSPRLTGWGLASLERRRPETMATTELATLAPELLDGQEATAASDIYALGALVFLLLTGSADVPRSPADVVLDLHRSGVPGPVAEAVAQAVATSPQDRFKSAEDFGFRLQSVEVALGLPITSMTIHSPTASVPRPSPITATPSSPAHDDVQFTVYRPTAVRPAQWYPLLAFAHRGGLVVDDDGHVVDPVQLVERQAQAILSDQSVPFDSVRTDATSSLTVGTDLLLEPWLEEGEFNPPRATLQWVEHVHRVEFRMRVPAAADGRRVAGGLRVFAGPLLIGELTFRLAVGAGAGGAVPAPAAAMAAPAPAVAGGRPSPAVREVVQPFRQIFASYAHADTDVVRAVAQYVSLTGDRYVIDVQTLRSGERWERRLEEFIEQADVFQLFWSHNAMRSQFVRQELEYALALGRDHFVRPVYWEEPLPTDREQGLPPKEVLSLHFSKLGVDAAAVGRAAGPAAPAPLPTGAQPGVAAPAPAASPKRGLGAVPFVVLVLVVLLVVVLVAVL